MDYTSEQIAKAAVDSARDRALLLISGAKIVAGAAEAEPEALEWLAEKLSQDADAIAADLDHAQHALAGKRYHDWRERFGAYLPGCIHAPGSAPQPGDKVVA